MLQTSGKYFFAIKNYFYGLSILRKFLNDHEKGIASVHPVNFPYDLRCRAAATGNEYENMQASLQ